MSTAVDMLHHFKPIDQLEQSVYRTITRLKGRKSDVFRLKELEAEPGQVTARYSVSPITEESGHEAGSLAALAITGMLLARAVVTRKPVHWAGALGAGSVAVMTAGTLVKRAGSAVRRIFGGDDAPATLRVEPDMLVFSYGDQDLRVDLAPMVTVVLRNFRHKLKGRQEQFYLLQIELQDGKVVTVNGWDEALAARRAGHQVARALRLSMAFQNIDVTEVENGVSWELGPQLAEPALN